MPLTSNVTKVYPFQVLVPAGQSGLRDDSKAQAEQVRSVGVGRLLRRVGSVPADLMHEVDESLRLHLAL